MCSIFNGFAICYSFLDARQYPLFFRSEYNNYEHKDNNKYFRQRKNIFSETITMKMRYYTITIMFNYILTNPVIICFPNIFARNKILHSLGLTF